MERDSSYGQWLRTHYRDWSEGCTCEVCRALSDEDRVTLRRLWLTWRAATRQPEVTQDKLLQRELELNPEKTNWGMF